MHRSDRFISINPVNGAILGEEIPWDKSKIKRALNTGELDWQWWRGLSVEERLNQIRVIKNNLVQGKAGAAVLITEEMGKPIAQSIAEINKCIDLCDYYLECAEEVLTPDCIDDAPFAFNEIVYQPLGGILGIMPWNFPFWQVFRFALPALISGNIIWLKHAPNMSLCNRFMERLFNTGLSQTIYRAVFVHIKDLEQLVQHKHIQGTSLTGSERAGASLAALSGKHIKKTILELGGNDAFVICPDADMKKAVSKAVFSRMINSGQTCISTKRVYVPVSHLSEIKEYIIEEIGRYVSGDLNNELTKIGVMARPDLTESIHQHIKEVESDGYIHWVTVGKDLENFVAPRVYYSDLGKSYDKELFGPVLIVYGYSDINQVMKHINASAFGLGTAIWSDDIVYAKELARNIDVGSVAINNIVQSNAHLPFGGIKKSGFGRELGKEALLEFVNKKVIYS